jgi:hypothetical protein
MAEYAIAIAKITIDSLPASRLSPGYLAVSFRGEISNSIEPPSFDLRSALLSVLHALTQGSSPLEFIYEFGVWQGVPRKGFTKRRRSQP